MEETVWQRCDTSQFERTLIIHANVYDQDQGLTGRYHNTTLQINKSYKHHNTSQGPRGLEYKCSIIDESAEATLFEYRHMLNKLP